VSSRGRQGEVEREYDGGTLICREGEISQEMYVIQSGRVRIFKGGAGSTLELATLDKGDFFGEMSVLEGLPRDASAEAVGNTRVLVLSAGALLVRLRRDPTFAFELLRRLSGRVRALNARLLAGAAPAVAATTELNGHRDSLLYLAEGEQRGES
jgi:CRP/FNR family transcriptional regulator, cyclic AMP receptor protein